MKRGGYLGVYVVLLAWASMAAGRTLHVEATGGGDFTSIQAALEAAVSGRDEIEVGPGTYYEAIDFGGKAIELYSRDGAAVTVINGTGHDHVVLCVTGEGAGTILKGFTITGGNARGPGQDECGGGLYNSGTSPTVADCLFTDNSAALGGGIFNEAAGPSVTGCTFRSNVAATGGGIASWLSTPTVTGCTFLENTASGAGGGMYNGESDATVTDCTFDRNLAATGGGLHNDLSSPLVTNCLFTANAASDDGGGMCNLSSNPTVTNCTFSGNSAEISGGGMFSAGIGSASTVTNCVLWSNLGGQLDVSFASLVVTYSDVQGGWTGAGNLDADPLFVDAANDDYHLAPGSPCIDAGTNTPPGGLPSTDIEGNPRPVDGNGDGVAVADMGAYEAPPVTPEQLVKDIIEDVLDLHLEPAVRTSLTAPLRAALRLVSDGNTANDASAVGPLTGFIKTVTAYRGTKIAAADADALLAAAQAVIDLLRRK